MGPFKLTYGQRWELKPGEHQKTAVAFTPQQAGTFRGVAYYYWDMRGATFKEVAIRYVGTAVPAGQLAPAPGVAGIAAQASVSPPTTGGWHHSNVTVKIEATDSFAPIRAIFYALSGAQKESGKLVQGSSASVVISAAGVTTITYFAVDVYENAGKPQTLTVRVDKSPLAGWVFIDTNGDGWIQDAEQAGLANVRLNLTRDGAAYASTTSTVPRGWYAFEIMEPGSYCLSMKTPPGYSNTSPIERCFAWAGTGTIVNFGVTKANTVRLPLILSSR